MRQSRLFTWLERLRPVRRDAISAVDHAHGLSA